MVTSFGLTAVEKKLNYMLESECSRVSQYVE